MKAVLFERKNKKMMRIAIEDVMHYSTAVKMLEYRMVDTMFSSARVNHTTYTDKESIYGVCKATGLNKSLTYKRDAMGKTTDVFEPEAICAAITVTTTIKKETRQCREYCIIVVDEDKYMGAEVLKATEKLDWAR